MAKWQDKIFGVSLENEKESEKIIKALDCKTRRDILRLLAKGSMGIWEIAQTLNVPLSTISEHVKVLVRSGLVTIFRQKNDRGRGKIVTRQYEKIQFDICEHVEGKQKFHTYTQPIPIGAYSDFCINQYCGMVGVEGYIGCRDNKDSFYSPLRSVAQLIWFDFGYLEYSVPFLEIDKKNISSISFSAEICSEAPGYDENWRSDIYFEINGKEVCLYTSPSDFGSRRGKRTPEWWNDGTQYGLLKSVEVTKNGTFLDGVPISMVTVDDLKLSQSSIIKFRIGVRENAQNRGGINLFGSKFGDYPQHIAFTVVCEE